MLYLLRSYTKDGSMLKLGYANDYEYRLSQYQAHNPGIEEISKRSGDIVDETLFHLYLHFVGYGIHKDEWYVDCLEVINIFSIEYELLKEQVWINRDKIFRINCIQDRNKTQLLAYETLVQKFGLNLEESNIDNLYFKKQTKDQETTLISKLTDPKIVLSESDKIVKSILSIRFFQDRLKYIYSLNLSKNEIEDALNMLPNHDYIKYYSMISPTRAHALNYQRGRLEKEYNKIIKTREEKNRFEELKKKIYSAFKIGTKHSKAEIKSTLRGIYSEVGISKTPKAVDLDEYFEVKRKYLTNRETGTRYEGFEIISRKD